MANGEPPIVPIPDRPTPLQRLLAGASNGAGGGFGGLGVVDRRRVAVVVGAAVAVLAAALAGYLLLRTPPAPPTELRLPYAGGAAPTVPGAPPSSTTTIAAEIVVHAAGAVVTPGIHRVPAGSRVADLLTAAGGPAPDADLDRVNLAAALTDGERVWFPRIGEELPPPLPGSPGSPTDPNVPAGPVDLNAATVDQLDALPGIGPAIAAAIVEHRTRSGPFRTVDDLLDVPGIGDAKLAQLRDLVTV